MEKVLFITNKLFIDLTQREGGVRNCTLEFIALLKTKFEVILFPVEHHLSLEYRIRVKLSLNHYNDYLPENYKEQIKSACVKNDIRYVFLNLSNTITFSSVIKSISRHIKVILCSHGNETGDYLHSVVRFSKSDNYLKKLISSYSLGKLLKIEARYRVSDVDMVLAVSEVEEHIEKWLGARNTFMVPRIIKKEYLELNPVLNRVGFMGDLSHTPNFRGLEYLFDGLSQQSSTHSIDFRLVGGPEKVGEIFAEKYPFVTYLGFLSHAEIEKEAASWCYFVNVVFYYSRGVSTKLAKSFSWGLPVISTVPGNRGYIWKQGNIVVANDPNDMARKIIENSNKIDIIKLDQEEVKKVVESTPTLIEIMEDLNKQMMQLK